jgi:hypothetical protein
MSHTETKWHVNWKRFRTTGLKISVDVMSLVSKCHVMKARSESRGKASHILNLCSQWRCVFCFMYLFYSWRKSLQCSLDMNLSVLFPEKEPSVLIGYESVLFYSWKQSLQCSLDMNLVGQSQSGQQKNRCLCWH